MSTKLGTSLPEKDTHACSVSLPAWKDVVGYEEGCTKTVRAMTIGYPRFRYHNDVIMLSRLLTVQEYFERLYGENTNKEDFSKSPTAVIAAHDDGQMANCNFQFEAVESLVTASGTPSHTIDLDDCDFDCMVLPSKAVALRFCKFMANSRLDEEEPLLAAAGSPTTMKQVAIGLDYHAVFFRKTEKKKAKSFWQHSGEILSSRQAQVVLALYAKISSLRIVTVAGFKYTHPTEGDLCTAVCVQLCNVTQSSDFVRLLKPCISSVSASPLPSPPQDPHNAVLRHIKNRISEIITSSTPSPSSSSSSSNHEVVLTVSGMASLFTAFRLALRFFYHRHQQDSVGTVTNSAPPSPPDFVVFGFPYLDTLKILQREEWNRGKAHFYGHGGEEDFDNLATLLESGHAVAAVFTEFPSNPLLKCPNLKRLSALSEQYGFLLVVDDTISNFLNIDLLHSQGVCVDLVCSSLTKIFSGVGNVMAGSMVLNMSVTNARGHTREDRAVTLRRMLMDEMVGIGDIPTIGYEDAQVLEYNSRDFLPRSHRINANALHLAQWLQKHPAVQKVYYPGLWQDGEGEEEGRAVFDLVKKGPVDIAGETHQPGYGCLLSIVLKPHLDTSAFYDQLDVRKGPSLGTSFTLACPFVLLAHYQEMEWAEDFGVMASLIRVSVGLEDAQDLISVFTSALDYCSSVSSADKL